MSNPVDHNAGAACNFLMLAGGLALPVYIACVAPILPHLAGEQGGGRVGELFAQSMGTLPSLGAMLGGLVTGLLLGRFGIRTMLIIAALVYAASSLITMQLDSAIAMLIIRVLGGFVAALLGAGTLVLIGASFGERRREQFIGWRSAFMSFAGIALIVGAGFLAEFAGIRSVFLIPAGFGLLLALFVFVARMPRAVSVESNVDSKVTLKPNFSRDIWILLILIFMLSIVAGIPGVQIPFKLAQIGVTAPSKQGLLIAIAPLIMVLGGLLFEPINRRFGHVPLFPGAVTMIGLGCVAVGLSQSIAPIAIGMAAIAAGIAFGFPYLIASLVAASSPNERSTALGYSTTALSLGAVLNPYIVIPFTIWLNLTVTLIALGSIIAVLGAIAAVRQKMKPAASPANCNLRGH